MNRKYSPYKLGIVLGAMLFGSMGLLFAQDQAVAPAAKAASGTVTFTVTAVGKKEATPPIAVDDVQLFTGKERKQIADWKKGDKLFLAILIDDSLDSTAAGQWDYLREFIMAQPPSTYIAVGYIANNSTRVMQDFTDNHELAAKALRIPLGLGAIGSSPYLGTLDMLKRWPETGLRRSILLISSGIDFFRGGGMGAFYPDLDGVISRAERQNTNIWTMYYPSASHRSRSFWLATYGQNNLDKMAEDTGGESYFLGPSTPVSLKPYFDEVSTHLSNQYLLTFAGSGGTKGKYQNVKVKTEMKDVEFFSPAAVYLPGTK
jgi:hypothetical protein